MSDDQHEPSLAAGALVVTEADTFGALILADLAAAAAAADTGGHDD